MVRGTGGGGLGWGEGERGAEGNFVTFDLVEVEEGPASPEDQRVDSHLHIAPKPF